MNALAVPSPATHAPLALLPDSAARYRCILRNHTYPAAEIRSPMTNCDLPSDNASVAAFQVSIQPAAMATRIAGYGGLPMPLRLALGLVAS